MNRRQFLINALIGGLSGLLLPRIAKAEVKSKENLLPDVERLSFLERLDKNAMAMGSALKYDGAGDPDLDKFNKYRCTLTSISAPDRCGNDPLDGEQFLYFPCALSIHEPDDEPFRWNIKVETRELSAFPASQYFRAHFTKNGNHTLGGIYELKRVEMEATPDRQNIGLVTAILALCPPVGEWKNVLDPTGTYVLGKVRTKP